MSFQINTHKNYEHYNFTEDDIRYIFFNFFIKDKYRLFNEHEQYNIYSSFTIENVYNIYPIGNNIVPDYMFTILCSIIDNKDIRIGNIGSNISMSYNVYEFSINGFLTIKKRNNKISQII